MKVVPGVFTHRTESYDDDLVNLIGFQEKTSNLLEPGPASQDASLSPIQELQDENEDGTSTCGNLRTSEMKVSGASHSRDSSSLESITIGPR